MDSCCSRDLEHGHSPWSVGGRGTLQGLALCVIALAALGFTVSVVTAASDPDWIGTAPKNISQSDTDEAWQPAIAAGPSGQIVVAWNDLPPRKSEVYVRSNDHGRSWDPPTRISRSAAKSRLPDVLVTDGWVFVAWAEEQDNAVYEAELGGDPRPVSIPAADGPSRVPTGPRLAAGSDQRVHVVFNAGKKTSSHIYHSARALGDTTWPTARRIYTSADGVQSWFPVLAVSPDGADLHLVWEKVTLSEPQRRRDVLYMRGATNSSGVSWESPLTLSADRRTAVQPDIAVNSSGDVHVVWGEAEEDSYYVRYRRYDASKESWSASKRIDSQPVYVNEINPTDAAPRLALWETRSQVHLCVTWHGFREGRPEEDALLSCSQDGGKTWRPPRTMSPLPEGIDEEVDISIWPSIVFDAAGTLHGVWQQRVATDDDGSYYEIYYARALNRVFLPLVIRNG